MYIYIYIFLNSFKALLNKFCCVRIDFSLLSGRPLDVLAHLCKNTA